MFTKQVPVTTYIIAAINYSYKRQNYDRKKIWTLL